MSKGRQVNYTMRERLPGKGSQQPFVLCHVFGQAGLVNRVSFFRSANPGLKLLA